MENSITMRYKNKRLIFVLNPEIEFAQLLEEFRDKMPGVNKLTSNTLLEIEFSNRRLSEDEREILVTTLKEMTSITIMYLYYNQEGGYKPLVPLKHVPDFSIKEGMTKYHHGTLRSGHKLQYDGHVVIFGDVNPGAEVTASGNILVIGRVGGVVHAGKDGERRAVVGAVTLNPIRIGIGEFIAKNPVEGFERNKKIDRDTGFEVAYVQNGEIILDFLEKI